MTAAIKPSVDSLPLVIEPAIDAIAFSMQAFGAMFPARLGCAIRASIQPTIDTVTAVVEPFFDSVAAMVEAPFSSVARVRHGACAQQQSGNCGKTE
jgi:hypothetical protein